MGQVLWILDADAAPDVLGEDLWALCHFSRELDSICKEQGVRQLSEFHDVSEAAADFDIEIEPVISEPSDLLATLSALLPEVAQGERVFRKDGVDRRADLEAELQEAIRVARDCQEKNKKVRVSLVS